MIYPDEPEGWYRLCTKLQKERDPVRFQELLDQINRLLTAHEKGASTRRGSTRHRGLKSAGQ